MKVVVIGSGFGGLACALLLARQGCDVTVLERQEQPGGCLQSYRRGTCTFDTGLHYVGGLAEGQSLYSLFDELGLMQLPWHRLDADGFDRVTIGGETFVFAEGYGHFADTLAERFPHEREALRQYTDLLRDLPSMQDIGEVAAYDYLRQTFRDPLLIDVLAGTSMKTELRRESLPLFHFAHGLSSYVQSSWRLQGDGNIIVNTLIEGIRSCGGAIRCSTEVVELIEREGRISAARCADGSVCEGDVFVSDVHPTLTFQMVKQSTVLKRIFRHRFDMLANTVGMFTASLVLKPATLSYFNHNKYIYRRANVWDAPPEDGTVDRVMVSCRVPVGDAPLQVDLLTPMPWSLCQPWADTSVGRRGADYLQMKQRMAEACISLAEQQLPGLQAAVSTMYTYPIRGRQQFLYVVCCHVISSALFR